MLRDLVYNDLMARGRTEATAKEWGAVAGEFAEVCGEKESYGRADLTTFLTHMRARDLKPSTIDKNLKSIRLLSQIQGWEFPKLTLKHPSPYDVTRPTLSKENVGDMIMWGKTLFTPHELCYLAISTTYGLRRAEMARLEYEDLRDGALTIHTAKGGRLTTHLIPPEITPYLLHFRNYKRESLSNMFQRLASRAGMPTTAGYGWHSIRRSLVTELMLVDASPLDVLRFMRWSDSSARGELRMLTVYAQMDQERIDQAIFDVHPFLPYWREA